MKAKFSSYNSSCLITGRNVHRLASVSVYFSPCFSSTSHISQMPGVAPLHLSDSKWAQGVEGVFLEALATAMGAASTYLPLHCSVCEPQT